MQASYLDIIASLVDTSIALILQLSFIFVEKTVSLARNTAKNTTASSTIGWKAGLPLIPWCILLYAGVQPQSSLLSFKGAIVVLIVIAAGILRYHFPITRNFRLGRFFDIFYGGAGSSSSSSSSRSSAILDVRVKEDIEKIRALVGCGVDVTSSSEAEKPFGAITSTRPDHMTKLRQSMKEDTLMVRCMSYEVHFLARFLVKMSILLNRYYQLPVKTEADSYSWAELSQSVWSAADTSVPAGKSEFLS